MQILNVSLSCCLSILYYEGEASRALRIAVQNDIGCHLPEYEENNTEKEVKNM